MPSRNELDKMHWGRRMRIAREFRDVILGQVIQSGLWPISPPAGRVAVRITRYCAGRLDPDNMSGGCKPLLDALVQLEILEDDTEECVEVEYRQKKGPRGHGRTEVEVWR